jgi:hypothetical protein
MMAEPIYVEADGCRHFHVDGFRCENCGAELRWVVEKEIDNDAESVYALLEDMGVYRDRLAAVLEPGVEHWGSLIHAFEVVTALSVVLHAWPSEEGDKQ